MTPPPRDPPARRIIGLGPKLVLWFTLVFTVVFLGAFYWFYTFVTEQALGSIVRDMTRTVRGAAAGLEGEALVTLAREGVRTDDARSEHPLYAEQLAWLETVHQIEPRAWPYTYVPGAGENDIVALVDLWITEDPNRSFGFLDDYTSTGPLIRGLAEETFYVPRDVRCDEARASREGETFAAVRGTLRYLTCLATRRVGYTDAYGSWVSAYAPIVGENGEILGAIGLDFESAYVDQVQDALLAGTGRALMITYAVLIVLVLLASRLLTRPIGLLTAAAERVGEGDYEVDFARFRQRRWRDEIGVLSEVLAGMVDKVRVREQTLRKQVQELRIEIDEAKRKEQVAEIVDTDFFRDLQSKAANMRSRKARGAGEAAKPSDGEG
jgi:HAMP domain-containing protein